MSKRVGIMQPYLFPYLGYFQLISAVDEFVLYDDVQHISRGWVNRNRILINGKASLITFPLKKASFRDRINERTFSNEFQRHREKILRIIDSSYRRAPSFKRFFPVLEGLVKFDEPNLALYAENSIRGICAYLGIETPIRKSSDLAIDPELKSQDRVIETVRLIGADVCINPIGGVAMYDFDTFKRNGITLKFHRMGDVRYTQNGCEFVPSLSIIDVLMFNDPPSVRKLFSRYTITGREAQHVREAFGFRATELHALA